MGFFEIKKLKQTCKYVGTYPEVMLHMRVSITWTTETNTPKTYLAQRFYVLKGYYSRVSTPPIFAWSGPFGIEFVHICQTLQ